jgi:hypothetical protein
MSITELLTEKPELVKFRQAEAEIDKMKADFMPLKVESVNDKKGLDTVHNARMIVKNLRVTIEKKRKELKADALEYGRMVDSVAKQLADKIEPISISPDGTHAQTVQERVTCLAFTIGGLWARSGITRYAHLAKWIATASDAEINEVFDGLENGN